MVKLWLELSESPDGPGCQAMAREGTCGQREAVLVKPELIR